MIDLQISTDPSSKNLFVVSQAGKIFVFENKAAVAQNEVRLFLDISSKVTFNGELGLLVNI